MKESWKVEIKIVRASEIGLFEYCQRAWWYHNQGIASQNQEELALGSQLHERHGRKIIISGCLRFLAYLLIGGALLMLFSDLLDRLI